MTFTDIVSDINGRLNYNSTDATTRIGKAVNRAYRRVTSAIGLIVSRRVTITQAKSLGSNLVTFSGIEKIDRVIDDASGDIITLREVTYADLRALAPGATTPSAYAVVTMAADSVTIMLDVEAQDTDGLKADGLSTVADLSGTDEPSFPESYHDILIEAVLAEELRKQEKPALAKLAMVEYERILSDLKFFIAKSGYLKTQQNSRTQGLGFSGSGGGGSSTSGGLNYTQTGLVTFDRDPATPFAVTAGSAKVDNLEADLLDGEEGADFHEAAYLTGGPVPLAVLSGITNSQIAVAAAIAYSKLNLATSIVNADINAAAAIAYSKLNLAASIVNADIAGAAAIAASKLAPPGSDTHVIFNDGGAFAGEAGMVYNKTTDVLSLGTAVALGTNPSTTGSVRLPNTGTVIARNQANDTDLTAMNIFSDNKIYVGDFQNDAGLVLRSFTEIAVTKGITFPSSQVASSDVNTLDDYEEGTWTPTLGGSATYTTQTGYYTKIGRVVHVKFTVIVNAIGTGSTTTISNLPFTATGSDNFAGAVAYAGQLVTQTQSIQCLVNGATITFSAFAVGNAGNTMDYPLAVFQGTTNISASATYIV